MAVVCQKLAKVPRFEALSKVKAFPPTLDKLYGQMMDQIRSLAHALRCKQVLGIVSAVYPLITLNELASSANISDDVSDDDHETLAEIIGFCGSFLTLREHNYHLLC